MGQDGWVSGPRNLVNFDLCDLSFARPLGPVKISLNRNGLYYFLSTSAPSATHPVVNPIHSKFVLCKTTCPGRSGRGLQLCPG